VRVPLNIGPDGGKLNDTCVVSLFGTLFPLLSICGVVERLADCSSM